MTYVLLTVVICTIGFYYHLWKKEIYYPFNRLIMRHMLQYRFKEKTTMLTNVQYHEEVVMMNMEIMLIGVLTNKILVYIRFKEISKKRVKYFLQNQQHLTVQN